MYNRNSSGGKYQYPLSRMIETGIFQEKAEGKNFFSYLIGQIV
jgi:hypothetical protein